MMRAALLCGSLLASQLAAGQDLAMAPSIVIRDVQLESNELIPQAVFAAARAPYLDRSVSSMELQQLAQRLTQYLVERGYVSSGVVVPDQKIEAGVVRLRVVEGRIATIAVHGNGRLRERYFIGRLDDVLDRPLHVGTLAGQLQLLQQDPLVARLDADIRPGVERGTAVLNLDVATRKSYGFSVGIDNHVSPNVGDQQYTAELHHLNLLGFGDTLQLAYRRAEGFDGGSIAYDLPFLFDTTLGVLYERSESHIVAEPFAALDIEGDSTRYGASLRRAFMRSPGGELTLGIGLEAQEVRSYLLGEPFGFAASDANGMSRATVATLTQEWVRRDAKRVLALRSTFNFGLAAFDATIGGAADGEFAYWLGQAQWLQKISLGDGTVSARLQLRAANDALPGHRKYGLGGAESVRGYRENLFVRDNGALLSIEWSTPLAHVQVPGLSREASDGELRLAPFADYGYGRDDGDVPAPVDIASVGVALHWRITAHSFIELQLAKALIDRTPAALDEVLQDEGVHVGAQFGW